MKLFCLVLLLTCRLACAQTNFYPLLNCSNRIYTNATISSFTPATASIMWDGGGERVAITNLPPDAQIQCQYDPAKEKAFLATQRQQRLDRQQAVANANAVAAKAKGKMGKDEIIRITKSISGGAEVQIIYKDKYAVIYVHNIPSDVLAYIDDYNNTREDYENSIHANANETVGISGPFRRSGEYTAVAESIQRTRRHMTDLDQSLISRTSIIARPTQYITGNGLRQWEYISKPTIEEAEVAEHERTRRYDRIAASGN